MAGRLMFSSPSEFLSYVRVAYSIPIPGDDDAMDKVWEVASAELKQHSGQTLPRPDPEDPYGPAIEELNDALLKHLTPDQRTKFQRKCAFGALDHPSVNAFCVRSPDEFYAMVLHHGLMNFYHKFIKLMLAAERLDAVHFCSRKDPRELSREDVIGYLSEFITSYRLTGVTRGPIVRLAMPVLGYAGYLLTLAEAFVVGHEAGHFLAGHLEDDANFRPHKSLRSLGVFEENRNHMNELEADAYGFRFMRTFVDQSETDSDRLMAVASVIVFEGLRSTGSDSATSSHPATTDRLKEISRQFLGDWGQTLVRHYLELDIRQFARTFAEGRG
jgi:hypothetical protein